MLMCAGGAAWTTAPWSQEVLPGVFGPRAQATVTSVTGRQGIGPRDAQELLRALFHRAMSPVSIAALEQQISTAVAEPMAEVQVFVQVQPAVQVDEAGWREGTRRCIARLHGWGAGKATANCSKRCWKLFSGVS